MAAPGTVFEGHWSENEFLAQPEIARALRKREPVTAGAIFAAVNGYAEHVLRIQKQYAEWTALPLLKANLEQLETRLGEIRQGGKGCLLPLGWGAGFLSKAAFLNTQDEAYRGILKQVQFYARAIQSGLPFPKTRKVIFLGNQAATLAGFVELEILK